MEVYFKSSRISIKNLETFFVGQRVSDILLTLDNLQSSSSLLGFVSIAHKADVYLECLHQSVTCRDKFADMLSDLVFELRRSELEWIRKQNAIKSLSRPHREMHAAVRRRRWVVGCDSQ